MKRERAPHPTQTQEGDKCYKPGISLKVAEYLGPLGKAPVGEAWKHLYSIFPVVKQILVKPGRRRGLTAQCPYLSLQGHQPRGAYNLVLDKVAHERFNFE